MTTADLEVLRFPIGKFSQPSVLTDEIISSYIQAIAEFPGKMNRETSLLSDEQLNTPYRPDGWTIRQVVHHCADSHLNSFVRFKLALTEDEPIIKPYFEERWAELPDSQLPVAASLSLLQGLHERWAILLASLTSEQLDRTFVHPEHGKHFSLKETIGIYAWHCEHHLAHITELKKRKGWA
ncbi:MAG: putative metal-dependent hydrolase [Bacteroidota bacterium]